MINILHSLIHPTHIMGMADPVAVSVETLRIARGCSLEKQYAELICMNP